MNLSRTRAAAAMAALAVTAVACGSGGGGSSSGGSGGSSGSSGGSGGSGGGNAATSNKDATGITANSITLGSHQPLTGPAAPGYSEIAPASDAYFKYVNAAGGINGRKITYKYLDDGYNPAQTVSVVRQLVQQDRVAALISGLGTPTHTKVLDFLNQSKVPDLFVSSGALSWDNVKKYPETTGFQVDYYREGKILGQYVKKNFPGKKIAYFSQGDEFGEDGVRGLDTQIDKASVVDRETYQPGNTNVAPQVQKIVQANPDVTVLFTIPAYTALYKLNALKLGFPATKGLVVGNVGSDPVTLSGLLESIAKKAGANVNGKSLLEGIVTDTYLPPYLGADASSNSWIQLFKKVHDQYIPNLPFDGNVLVGMAQAYTFTQVLQKAGKDVTRGSLMTALEQGGLTGPGLVPFGFSPTSHSGYTGTQIVTLGKNGDSTLVGTPLTTDDSTGPIQPYSQKQPPAPASGIPTG